MQKRLAIIVLRCVICLLITSGTACARQVIEAVLPRSVGDQPVVIRGLLDAAPVVNGKVLMIFPGWPGIPRIELKDGKPAWLYLQQHVEDMKLLLHQAGISLMTVDCPTDQWGVRGPNPTACGDAYRSSLQHAQDVRALISQTRQMAPLQQFYVMGHSYGAVSSHWLAIHLGDELAGSVHSATQSVGGSGPYAGYGYSISGINMDRLPRHSIFLHHRDDLCPYTPYEYARRQGVHRLMTVVGGNRWAEPCGKASYHSYSQRSTAVGIALVRWINEGIITPLIQGEQD